MALSFQNAHSKFLHSRRTPPLSQNDCRRETSNTQGTATGLVWGCSNPKIQASFTFHTESFLAAFENRPPWPRFDCLKAGGYGMGLFERLPLPDQVSSDLCGGLSRGLLCNGLLVSISFFSGSAAARAVDHCRSRGSLEKSAMPSLERLCFSRYISSMAQKPFFRFRASRRVADPAIRD